MVAKLVIEDGNLKGRSFSLEKGESWVIGRDPDECQFVLEDPLVSRRHVLVYRSPDGILVENLSTTNPVLINEQEIGSEPYLLHTGDFMRIGHQLFRYYETLSEQLMNEEPEQTDPLIPSSSPPSFEPPLQEGEQRDTLFEDQDSDFNPLAEINFGFTEIGRWLLKVIGGPNNGAEFYMQTGHSYIIGTDPHACDIVFHDTSVSRQHAKITVTPDDVLVIEDLKSRNGVLINGELIEAKQTLSPSTIVTLGTTSFVVYDREGEMQTIVSPLMPSIVKALKQEEEKPLPPPTSAPSASTDTENQAIPKPTDPPPPQPPRQYGPLILMSIIMGLFALAGIGSLALFKSEPIEVKVQENTDELIQQALRPFPAVRFTFNKANGGLFLVGHVSSPTDKHQLLYNLQNLKFIKSVDDNGIIVDEYVWQELNSILAKTWRGITIQSPAAGEFVLTGYLETRRQAAQLSDYINLNFPYLDLLKKQVVVEEDVVNQINAWLQDANLRSVTVDMNQGEISLSGNISPDRVNDFNQIITRIKQIPGVRIVNNAVHAQAAPELVGIENISDQYQVTGTSKIGDKHTVVIQGRILSEGDILDGMTITQITSDKILLEKDGAQFRINY